MRDANRISSSSAVAKLTGRRRALYRAGDPTIIRTAANPMASVPNQKPARCLPIAAISATKPLAETVLRPPQRSLRPATIPIVQTSRGFVQSGFNEVAFADNLTSTVVPRDLTEASRLNEPAARE